MASRVVARIGALNNLLPFSLGVCDTRRSENSRRARFFA
jgi:hypothetical protein